MCRKFTLLLLLTFTAYSSFGQPVKQEEKKVRFTAKVDSANLTKDGIYLDKYVVNIDQERVKQLHGRMIRIKGKVTTIPGVDNTPGTEMKQGRESATAYIARPKIRILSL